MVSHGFDAQGPVNGPEVRQCITIIELLLEVCNELRQAAGNDAAIKVCCEREDMLPFLLACNASRLVFLSTLTEAFEALVHAELVIVERQAILNQRQRPQRMRTMASHVAWRWTMTSSTCTKAQRASARVLRKTRRDTLHLASGAAKKLLYCSQAP